MDTSETYVVNHSRNIGRRASLIQTIFTLRAAGGGAETMMICSPNDPSHKEADIIWFEVDGKPEFEVVFNDVYDHLVKTVNEWCEHFKP